MTLERMNHVERFRAVMDFKPFDRLPRIEWAMWWGKTLDRWRGEGLPSHLNDTFSISQYFGLDPYIQAWVTAWAADPPSVPHGHARIHNMDDYLAIRPILFPRPLKLWPEWSDWAARQNRGELVSWLTLEGFFWLPRGLLGIENHLYAFYDEPELMHRIIDDQAEWAIATLRQMSSVWRPVFMTFAEDMSYNHGPMLSRALFDEYIAPAYRKVMPVLEELSICPIVDSDGDVTDLAGWLQDVGVRGILPLERQAGCDAGALRRKYPRLGMVGHFDKMTMPHGAAAMQAEFERLLPAMRRGASFRASITRPRRESRWSNTASTWNS
jgi:hypothetical protein